MKRKILIIVVTYQLSFAIIVKHNKLYFAFMHKTMILLLYILPEGQGKNYIRRYQNL